jgi:hypothetical protein
VLRLVRVQLTCDVRRRSPSSTFSFSPVALCSYAAKTTQAGFTTLYNYYRFKKPVLLQTTHLAEIVKETHPWSELLTPPSYKLGAWSFLSGHDRAQRINRIQLCTTLRRSFEFLVVHKLVLSQEIGAYSEILY